MLEVVPISPQVAVDIARGRAEAYVQQSKAKSTLRAYETRWKHFEKWCATHALCSLPADPKTVAFYLADVAPVTKPATLQGRIAAISKAHQIAGYESPASMKHGAVAEVWRGIRRVHGLNQIQKTPVLIDDIRRMSAVIETVDNVLLAVRDRALLLVGFAGAFRRAELVGLDASDIQFTADGLVITLRRSKTDQEGQGRKVGIPYGSTRETCPVRSLQRWMEAGAIKTGPLFRSVNRHGKVQPERLSDQTVAIVVKRYVEAAGLDPAIYAGHSLRSGLVTTAAIAGVSERLIMKQTGHKSTAMVRRYIRDSNLFRDNAAARIGL